MLAVCKKAYPVSRKGSGAKLYVGYLVAFLQIFPKRKSPCYKLALVKYSVLDRLSCHVLMVTGTSTKYYLHVVTFDNQLIFAH